MLRIIAIMAALAQGSKVVWLTILRSVVEVCNGENYASRLACGWVESIGVVLYSAELTFITCTFQYPQSYLFPVLRIAIFILGLNRHIIPPLPFSFLPQVLSLSGRYGSGGQESRR